MIKKIKFACPKCKIILITKVKEWYFCLDCNEKYPVKENIPILIMDYAEPLQKEDIIECNQSWKQSAEQAKFKVFILNFI